MGARIRRCGVSMLARRVHFWRSPARWTTLNCCSVVLWACLWLNWGSRGQVHCLSEQGGTLSLSLSPCCTTTSVYVPFFVSPILFSPLSLSHSLSPPSLFSLVMGLSFLRKLLWLSILFFFGWGLKVGLVDFVICCPIFLIVLFVCFFCKAYDSCCIRASSNNKKCKMLLVVCSSLFI